MSYNIGQKKKSDLSNFYTDVSNDGIVNFDTRLNTNFLIRDKEIQTKEPLDINTSYYLYFTVEKKTFSQNFKVQLYKEVEAGDEQERTQDLKSYAVEGYTENPDDTEEEKELHKYVTFEIIFSPNAPYSRIQFILEREPIDFSIVNSGSDEGTIGRIMTIVEANDNKHGYILQSVKNQVESLSGANTYLTKIGIQGTPGMLFTIGGEEIRVGKTGIYELYNEDLRIRYLGFMPTEKDNFIIDYKYEVTQ